MLNKNLIRQRFDRHAFEYDQYAHIQRRMAQWLLANIPSHSTVNSILEIGCGTGSLTLELRTRFPNAELTVIDLSPAMIAATRQKLADLSARVTFIIGDAESIIPQLAEDQPGSFDLIISNAAFQWFNEPEGTALACLHCLMQDGSFLFSTFTERTFEELRHSFAAAESLLNREAIPHGQSFLTSCDWRTTFANCRLPFQWSEQLLHEHYPDTRSFLHAVQRIGAGNAIKSNQQHAGIAGRILFKAMEQHYLNHYSSQRGIQVTYHIGYGVIGRVVD
jgi:malonyl-CoA O-methyltransferase